MSAHRGPQHHRRPADLRSFGRIRGRKLSPRQERLLEEVLPRVRVDLGRSPLDMRGAQGLTPAEAGLVSDLWLEIGFGGAEHLVWQAERNPHVMLIGCEPFLDGVVKALTAIEERGLGNVRIHAGDAREVIDRLPDACLGRVFILFPDPWPKARHHKRRLVSAPLVRRLARAMRPGAELRFATDIADYAEWAVASVAEAGGFGIEDMSERSEDWPATRYEAKAIREGRRCRYITWRRL